MDRLNHLANEPALREYLAIIKGARNGLVYGVKIRFPHALIMAILFGRGDWVARLRVVFKATKAHAINLASFVALYKALLLLQRKANGGKEKSADSFIAGLIGGFVVFGQERSQVNEQVHAVLGRHGETLMMVTTQIVLYVCSRVLASFIPRMGRSSTGDSSAPGLSKPVAPDAAYFSAFAALSWGAVMWLFRYRPETIQQGMFSSMTYLYRDSDKWHNLRTLLWQNK